MYYVIKYHQFHLGGSVAIYLADPYLLNSFLTCPSNLSKSVSEIFYKINKKLLPLWISLVSL